MTKTLITMLFACSAVSVAVAGDMKDKADKQDNMTAEVGKAAPDFALKDIDGKERKLSDYKGKVVVLEWTNCACPFVVRHQQKEHTMQKTYAKFEDKGVVWFAIDSTNPDFQGGHDNKKIKEWAEMEDVDLPYPILRDEDGKVGHMYGARTTPHMFVIDKEGTLVYSGAIDDSPDGSNENPNNYVEDAVNAVLKGSTVEVASTKPYGCSVKYVR